MKILISTVLILAVGAVIGHAVASPLPAGAMSSEEMSSALGGDFWGGLVCGAALTAAVIGTGAIITAATGGAALPLGMAFVASTGYHVTAVCLLIP